MKIAIIGASGAVGREIINELENSHLNDIQLVLLASPRSQGMSMSFRGKHLTVKAYSRDEVKDCAYTLMSAGSAFSKANAHAIAETSKGVVVDNSSAWRMDPSVPLIVPEINGALLAQGRHSIIANPNCCAIPLAMTLSPLQKKWGIELVTVATYQSVSGSGQKGIDELAHQVRDRLNFSEAVSKIYPQPIAFNILPSIGPIGSDGYCEEETKIIEETRKLMDFADLPLLATTARVPVFYCHSQAVTVKLKSAVTYEEAVAQWRDKPGITFAEREELQPTPLQMTGQNLVSISRVRLLQGQARSPWLTYWNISDNLKKGAATNAVQIVELLCGVHAKP